MKNLTKGMSITDAAIKAGYSNSTRAVAGQLGSQALENIRLKMPEVLENAGLTDESLVEDYLKPLLKATETKFFQKDGVVTDIRDVIAWGPRSTGLDMAFNLKGSYAPKFDPKNMPMIPVQIVTNITLPPK